MLARMLMIETFESPAAALQGVPVADQIELSLIYGRDHVDMTNSET